MSETFEQILRLIELRDVKISERLPPREGDSRSLGCSERKFISGCSRYRLQAGSDAVGDRSSAEEGMNTKRYAKMVHEGEYLAEM